MPSSIIQLGLGSAVGLTSIVIHALATIFVIKLVIFLTRIKFRAPYLQLIIAMTLTASVLLAAQVLEIAVWSLSYSIIGAISQDSDDFYFAFVNFTSLGYGDIIPLAHWHLMGPMTAMNGVMLFGWSTAVLFQVLTISLEESSVVTRNLRRSSAQRMS
ncbi:ion channel [Ochrobactrum chromiisoli]|uniref:Ion channel n=1 Tax=Ochrobactrum chromiisoli TaxID=2993941 RepID=A0ABT3QP41_9HYPH|nr:ion channel [Ochrobactrum chromiisoli]MCX2697377.1 ion channel [Ochrobactrum chromiisoli]